MKKLIIAAVAVCAAVAANAAVANWSINAQKVYSGNEKTAGYSGSGFVFDNDKMSQSALYAIIAAGTSIGSSTAGYAADITASAGSVSATKYTYSTWGEESSPTSFNYYMVFVDDANQKVYFSNIKNVAAPTSNTAKFVVMGSQNDGTSTFSDDKPDGTGFGGAGVWSAYNNAPEPTSGVLLLLGIAGLALKRKQK